jgi:hypothetical protein
MIVGLPETASVKIVTGHYTRNTIGLALLALKEEEEP